MSRRAKIRTASFLTALFVGLGASSLLNAQEAAAYRRILSASQQHAFAELTAQLEGLDSVLQKGRYATSPALLSSLCAEVYSRSCAAQAALGELPYSNIELEQTAAFLSKAGDYAWSVSRTAAGGGSTDREREALAGLAQVSADLTGKLHVLQEELNQGGFSLESVQEAEQRLSHSDNGQVTAGSSFQTMEKEFPELPTLIYDGPFSEHLTGRTPSLLEGRSDVDAETALRAAAAFLDRPADSLELVSVGEGALPTYAFSLPGEELYLEVTRQGGVVMELLSGRQIGPSQLLPESALAIAKDFLRERGYTDMAETYFIRQGGQFTVNFAWQDGEVLCYPDLIKVTVALDNGDVTAFEAEGYVTNHRDRDLPAPAVFEEEARAALPSDLTVLAHRLALIPTSGQYEVLCHEFKCENAEGQHVLVYVNARTGQEEKILLLLEDESGTLVK